jgi:hypothetical protein
MFAGWEEQESCLKKARFFVSPSRHFLFYNLIEPL